MHWDYGFSLFDRGSLVNRGLMRGVPPPPVSYPMRFCQSPYDSMVRSQWYVFSVLRMSCYLHEFTLYGPLSVERNSCLQDILIVFIFRHSVRRGVIPRMIFHLNSNIFHLNFMRHLPKDKFNFCTELLILINTSGAMTNLRFDLLLEFKVFYF